MAAYSCPTTADSRACRGYRRGEPQTPQSTAHLLQPPPWLAFTRLKASHTSRFGMSNGFALIMRLLPSPVGRAPRLNTTAPSVQRHYRAFNPTTGCSAPVLRLGTRDLTGIARSTSSLSIGATGSPVPCKSLIQVHAAFEPGAAGAGLQISAPTYPRMTTTPGSDPNNTISAVHRRFAFARLPGSHLTGSCPAFSATLTTIALYDSSSRWFGTGS